MRKCFRQCPKCGGTFAKFYVQEEPTEDKPFYLVVFVCQIPECKHEWCEAVYEKRILKKIASSGYREQKIAQEVEYFEHKHDEMVGKDRRKREALKINIKKGLSAFERERGVNLRIRDLGGFQRPQGLLSKPMLQCIHCGSLRVSAKPDGQCKCEDCNNTWRM